MKEYVLTEKDIENLRKILSTRSNYNAPVLNESIMSYGKVCKHDEGHLCEHRLEFLIKYIESKELKTRKTKLKKIGKLNDD
jgi:hypothetical protein